MDALILVMQLANVVIPGIGSLIVDVGVSILFFCFVCLRPWAYNINLGFPLRRKHFMKALKGRELAQCFFSIDCSTL